MRIARGLRPDQANDFEILQQRLAQGAPFVNVAGYVRVGAFVIMSHRPGRGRIGIMIYL